MSTEPEDKRTDAEKLWDQQAEQGGGIPTQYPKGKISNDDMGEGAFALALDPQQKLVHMRFPVPMTWVSFDEGKLITLIGALIEKLEQLRKPGKTGK